MAIKAIINNTEKEIEQIKNSDEQDIDYVYSRIGDTEVEGELPISIKSIGGNLADYRIYGNTVGGESVGDLVESGEHVGEYKIPVQVVGKNLVTSYLVEPSSGMQFYPVVFAEVNLQPNTEYLITFTVHENGVKLYSNDLLFTFIYYSSEIQGKKTMRLKTKTSIRADQHINNKGWVLLRNAKQNPSDFTITDVKLQLVSDAPIYLDEPLAKSGNSADYIDYAEQKMHRVRKNLFSTIIEQGSIRGADGSDWDHDARIRSDIGIDLPAGTYMLTWQSAISDTLLCFAFLYSTEGVFERRIPADWAASPFMFTLTDAKKVRFVFERSNDTALNLTDITNIMLNAGSTPLPYEPYIENTEVDVTLPALSTIKGTNILSVNTSIQPSNIYIKDSFDYKKVFTATRTIEDELPLNYRNIEDNDSTLDNYRIYGNTVGGESVGDRTGNLFDGNFIQGYWAYADGSFVNSRLWICTNKIPCTGDQVYTYSFAKTSRWTGFVWYDANGDYISSSNAQDYSSTPYRLYSATAPIDAAFMGVNIAGYPGYENTIAPSDITDFMLVEGQYTIETMPAYEPYGYKVPVTVSNGADTLTTPIYLPEQIRKVGNEAEYIDYGEQKQHRVRKNLLQNTATSQTKNGVTFTVNSDGSVTCNGTASDAAWFVLNKSFDIYAPDGRIASIGNNGSTSTFYMNISYVGNVASSLNFSRTIHQNVYVQLVIAAGYTCNNLTFYPMIRKADIEDDTYEPYIENTDVDVILPGIAVTAGTNTLSVGTEVQPSKVMVKGKLKRIIYD